jgi:TonB family protein
MSITTRFKSEGNTMLERIFAATSTFFIAVSIGKVMASDEYTFAKLVERQPFKYPRVARVKGWEGWAYYSYEIGTDGLVHNITILDSNGLDQLNNALIDHVESGIYEPATYNGVPVTEKGKLGRAVFQLTNKPRGAGSYFLPRYKKLVKALGKNDLESSWELIQELESKVGLSLYEELYLQARYVNYYTLTGDKDREYLHALRVLDFYAEEGSKDYIVEPEFFTEYLVRAYQYEIGATMLGDAFGTAELLDELAAGSEVNDNIQAHAQTVRKSVENKEFWMNGKLVPPIYGGELSIWEARLSRREVELKNVTGDIDAIDLHCERGIRRLTYTPGEGWIIPKSWGACDLTVTGRSGATFVVAEMPEGTLANAQTGN